MTRPAQPEEAAKSSSQASGKDWAEPVHPGPLLVSKHRTPVGGFFGDGRPYYARVNQPDPPEILREAAPAPPKGPDYPWLTPFQRQERGLPDNGETFKLTNKRNASGGFFTTGVGMLKI